MAIPCMNLTVAASGVFQFKVEGYSFTKEAVASERQYYQSETFLVGGQEWAVRYYPKKGGPAKYEVVLVLVSRLIEWISVRFSLTLLGKTGVPSDAMKVVTATVLGRGCGAMEVLRFLVPHESTQDFVMDDSFVLHCTVSILKKPVAF